MNDVPSFVLLATAVSTLVAFIQVFKNLAEKDGLVLSQSADRDPGLTVTAALES